MRLGRRLCANCFKIVESVERTAERFGGEYKLLFRGPGNVQVVLTCSSGHSWSIGMHSRKAKAWCQQCREDERAEQERRVLEEAERLQEERAAEQRRLQLEDLEASRSS